MPHRQQLVKRIQIHELQAGRGKDLLPTDRLQRLLDHPLVLRVAIVPRIAQQLVVAGPTGQSPRPRYRSRYWSPPHRISRPRPADRPGCASTAPAGPNTGGRRPPSVRWKNGALRPDAADARRIDRPRPDHWMPPDPPLDRCDSCLASCSDPPENRGRIMPRPVAPPDPDRPVFDRQPPHDPALAENGRPPHMLKRLRARRPILDLVYQHK